MTKLKIFMFALLLLNITQPLYAKKPAGTVIVLTGKAWAKINGKKQVLQIKSKIFAKDTLITDKNSRMQILFTDDSVLSLGGSTTVAISNFSFGEKKSPNMAIHIAKGIARMVSGKIVKKSPDKFTITSPLATIGIRGTITMHEVGPKSERHFAESLGEGHSVWIRGQDGGTVSLHSSLTGVDLQLGNPTPKKPRPQTWQEQKIFKESLSLAPSTNNFLAAIKNIVPTRQNENPQIATLSNSFTTRIKPSIKPEEIVDPNPIWAWNFSYSIPTLVFLKPGITSSSIPLRPKTEILFELDKMDTIKIVP